MRERALNLLRMAVENSQAEFRPGQWEAIDALLRRERLLLVQRTGWGKSNVYFLTSRLLRDQGAGCTLLISPLLALMRNQREAAARIGVRAESVNSSNSEDWQRIYAALEKNEIDVLLISPERLANDDFLTEHLLPIAGKIGLLVVDEAHCISDWGHDFRPDYRRIVRILQALPGSMPVVATTATANDRVIADIVGQLGDSLRVNRGPLTRDSLKLQNLQLPTKAERMAWLAENIGKFTGSGIVYTLTVHDAIAVSEWLRANGIDAPAYYGSLDTAQREALENRLLRNEVKALVATVALGMGFDKPDLGFVIHFQRPASVVHYYQQVGRAGRAVEQAYGILLSGEEEDEIADHFRQTAFPTEEDVTQVLEVLRRAPGPVKASVLQQQVNISRGKLERVFKFLLLESPSPMQKTSDGFVRNPVRWQMPRERIERVLNLRLAERERMREYVAWRGCLMQFLAAELNDPQAKPCGKCANCRRRGFRHQARPDLTQAAAAFFAGRALAIDPRKMWPALSEFEGMKGKITPELLPEPGRALCRWGDPGWGELVRAGKQRSDSFRDELVKAAASFIRTVWQPAPAPEWVTSVPSRRRPKLVPDFARRLAVALGLPYLDCMTKIRETEPQKTRQNSFQQAHNLEHAFQAQAACVRKAPVLLVDDMVDSRWTLTIAGFKLRQAGSGPVFPFALADASVKDGD